MEIDTWLNDCGEHYEHIDVCVYAMLIESKNPQGAVDTLTKNHHFKLKGTVPISYYLGCDFGRDGDGTLHFAPRKSISKMEECYCIMFGSKPKITVFHR